MRRPTAGQWVGGLGLGACALLFIAALVWRGDILQAWLDPQVPFQTYRPPSAPDYRGDDAWVLNEARIPGAGAAAVFFVHPTTYDGGRDWNAPIGDAKADAWLTRVVLPNYAGPFTAAGAVSAPRYRQASLYTRLTLREDAREARAFAYRDVAAAFDVWLARHPQGPLVLAGVEQGGELLSRLLADRWTDADLRRRLVAAYVMDAVIPADAPGPPLCAQPNQTGCVVAWSAVGEGDDGAARRRVNRALVWDASGRLVDLDRRAAACVNPVSGQTGEAAVPARRSQGATNATGLEWGVRPALMSRQIATQCRDGLLRHTKPESESFRAEGSWADRRKSRPFNLFYGDVEADVQRRLQAWTAG